MKPETNLQEDSIFTDDLCFTSPNGHYNYRFNYLGDGVFSLVSNGILDDKTLKSQLQSGDIARERLLSKYPDKPYHLIWDVTQLKRGSLVARYMAISKIKSVKHFGSITFIGANNFIRNFGLVASKLLPNIKLYFFQTYDEAIQNLEDNLQKLLHIDPANPTTPIPETPSYAYFIELWKIKQDTVRFIGNTYKIISPVQWQYSSPENLVHVKTSIIESNIVYFECEGFVKPANIDGIYGILENIMSDFGYNSTDNKFYTILDVKKIKGISLSARKKISYYEHLYKNRSFMVIIVANPTILFALKVLRKISLDEFFHWFSTDSPEIAFKRILQHRDGQINAIRENEKLISSENELIIPSSTEEMKLLIRKQHNELLEIKKQRHEEIEKIVETVGRITWDESFTIPAYSNENINPFHEVYNSLSILYQDFKEILEEKQLHTHKLIESEDKYRNLINLASDIILVYQDDKVKFLNSRAEQMLGYHTEDILGKSMDKFIAPEEIDKLRNYHLQRTVGNDMPWIYESVFLHHDGSRVPVSMSVGMIKFENRPASMVIARDITQKKKNEEELEKYRNHLEDMIKQRTTQLHKEISERKVAEESDRLKSAFLSNMSHEIRTPMNAIISFSNFLKEPDIPDQQRAEYLDYILSSGQSLLNLINDIIDISKIEAKQLNVRLGNCNINSILGELYKLFEETRKSIGKNNITIQVSIPDYDKKVILYTDPYRLKQILSNLLDNALKFTDSGIISFGYRIEENAAVIFVKDTGIGIPDDKKDYIFKRFGKIENLGRNLSGTGLGLAISKHLSALLNATLSVESKEAEGSCFYLTLPYSDVNLATEEQPERIPCSGEFDWEGNKILIAEDEDLNFKVLQIALRKTKAEILRAHNGKEALEMVMYDLKIDLILMDIQMPVMNGYESMLQIKKLRPDLPVIAQTAFALLEEQNNCLELGFNDYISKPIKSEELFQKIDMQFNNR